MQRVIPLETFESLTGIPTAFFAGKAWHDIDHLVPFGELVDLVSVQDMPREYLAKLMSNVSLDGDDGARPYAGCEIELARMDPQVVQVGQTFVERAKYRRLLENFSTFFKGFCGARGIAKRTAAVVLGRTADGSYAAAHYLPPIVEQNGDRLLLLDGVHRNFLIKAVGTTIETIIVRNVTAPFPCDPQSWEKVLPVDEKPPRPLRFFNLRPELFRNVKRIGIDG